MSKLAEIIKESGGLIQTGPFGSQLKQAEYTEQGVPVVMPKDIIDGRISTGTIARISETKSEQLSRHALTQGTIVFPRRGDIGKCALVSASEEGFLCGTGCIKIEPPKKRLNPHFLYYYLIQPHVTEWLERNAVGSTMLNLNTEIIGRIEIPEIPLPVQDSLVEIIVNYDSLIENNRRRIHLLEESARLLYQEWFVHLRFPGHEQVKIINDVPEGWEKKTLKKIATLNYGKALKAEVRVPGPFPVYGSSGEVGFHDKALVKGPGIVVGRKGNVGSVYWVNTDFYPIDTVYFVSAEESSLFLYHALQHVQFINTDVAVPGLNRDMAYSREILIPDDRNYQRFLSEVKPIQEQVNKLQDYNNKLVQARDLLLPKLMSGELTV